MLNYFIDVIWVVFVFENVSVAIGFYGFQHYLSILGSLILIPLVIVPAMGGNYVSHYTILILMFNRLHSFS